MTAEIEITQEGHATLCFIPQAVGGKVLSEEVRRRLEAKGFATPIREVGHGWLTELGDRIRLGKL